MDLEAARQHERLKYEAIYAGAETVPPTNGYGQSNHWQGYWSQLIDLHAASLCDVGTGHGGLPRKLFAERKCKWNVGVDFALPDGVATSEGEDNGYSLDLMEAYAHSLPFLDGSIEWVTAFDVLEHLVPEEVDDVLKEFGRVASKGFVFSICHKPSRITLKGENLHPTVQPEEWWIERIQLATGARVQKRGRYLFCVLQSGRAD